MAIGDNRRRKLTMDKASHCGFELMNVTSPSAVVSKYATLGMGIVLLPGDIVSAQSRLGAVSF
jgi:hypothetical protein